MTLTRREWLTRLGGTAALTAAAGTAGLLLKDRARRSRSASETLKSFQVEVSAALPELAVARGGDAVQNTRAALEALGGMGAFVSKGDRVMLKPNVAWKRVPSQAATTNPELVAELCRLCLDAGASEVVVFDSPCDPGPATFKSSGIADAVAGIRGASVVWPEKSDYVKVGFGGKLITNWAVWKELPHFDKVINAPIVKHHVQSRTTAGMKNWYGILGGDRGLLHQDMDGSIVDLAYAIRPTLTVLDAQRLLMRNGPTGGSLGDVKENRAVAAGVDVVALDAWAVGELGQKLENVGFIAKAEERGIGRADWRSLRLKEVTAG